MPAPRVFVSSTCYDLRYIRENLKFFVRTLGYEPVLSEEGAVFYNPSLHVQDACLADVPSCQMFVLIIGGRTGGSFKDSEKSITNAEYEEAAKSKLPVFALVERPVYEQYRLYQSNRANPEIDASKINYPSVDSPKVFAFIDQVQSQSTNNALVPFSDFEELQSYLRQQWASLLFRFLLSDSEARRTSELVGSLQAATENIEFLTRQLVKATGDPVARAAVELYDYVISVEVSRDLASWKITPSPKAILQHETFDSICANQVEIEADDDGFSLTYGGPPYKLSAARYKRNQEQYLKLRAELLQKVHERGFKLEQFIQGT
jgi:hypothetical protein